MPSQRKRADAEREKRQNVIDRESSRRQLTDMQLRVAQQQSWQRNVEQAMRNTMAYQARQTLMSELESMINPPAPPPEPEPQTVVYVSEDEAGSSHFGPDFNPKLWNKKINPWW
jgi:hypothetical protein